MPDSEEIEFLMVVSNSHCHCVKGKHGTCWRALCAGCASYLAIHVPNKDGVQDAARRFLDRTRHQCSNFRRNDPLEDPRFPSWNRWEREAMERRGLSTR